MNDKTNFDENLERKAYYDALSVASNVAKRCREVHKDFKRVLEVVASEAAYLARLLHSRGKTDEAINFMREATNHTPEVEEYRATLACWLADKAKEELKVASPEVLE